MKTVLVADDEAHTRLLFQEVLEEMGYSVVTVSSGREAVRKIIAGGIDLAILDIKMPDLHGIQILERLNSLAISIPIMLCTAYRHFEDDFTVATSGILAYFVKPINVQEVREKVKKVLG